MTALIVVDMQNDFANPDGSLFVQGADSLAYIINGMAAATQGPVVYTQDWHPPETPHFEPEGPWPVHCVEGTWGANLVDELHVRGPVVFKGQQGDGYSGFSVRQLETGETLDTGLLNMLQKRNVTDVIIVGVALDVCVKETALDAVRLGFNTSVFKGATASVFPENDNDVIKELRDAGVQTP